MINYMQMYKRETRNNINDDENDQMKVVFLLREVVDGEEGSILTNTSIVFKS